MQEIALALSAILVILGVGTWLAPYVRRLARALAGGLAAVRMPPVAGFRPVARPAGAAWPHRSRTEPALPSELPRLMTRDAQWERVSGVVVDAIARVETVHELQRSAEQQLDAATYAIQRLLAELSDVVRLPPAESVPAVAERTRVLKLAPALPPSEASGNALAA